MAFDSAERTKIDEPTRAALTADWAPFARLERTGKRISDLPGKTNVRVCFMALYRAAFARARPIFGRHTPPLLFANTACDRINLPIPFDDGVAGRVTGVVGRTPSEVAEPPPV